MNLVKKLYVPDLEPALKHPTIFQNFDQLLPGESFQILNDHDPKPLYYQLIAERGNIFTWKYIQTGPWFIGRFFTSGLYCWGFLY